MMALTIFWSVRTSTQRQYNEGAAWLFYGASGNTLSASGWFTESNRVAGFLGYNLASAGDVNKDGYDDVVIGATGAYDTFALVYYGSATGLPAAPSWRVAGTATRFWPGCRWRLRFQP